MRKILPIVIGLFVVMAAGYFFLLPSSYAPLDGDAVATNAAPEAYEVAEPSPKAAADVPLAVQGSSVETSPAPIKLEPNALYDSKVELQDAASEVASDSVASLAAPIEQVATEELAAGHSAEVAESPEPAASAPGDLIIASHVFAGPGQIPPHNYLAYGVIAFPQRPTPDTEYRYTMICLAFQEIISFTGEVAQTTTKQVVTIWPVRNAEIAAQINSTDEEDRCAMAVKYYHLPHSEHAIEAARLAGQSISTDRGPFLLAWFPGEHMGSSGVPVLDRDLSLVVTPAQAQSEFRAWKEEIRNHECWDCTNVSQKLRRSIRLYSDYYGARTIGVLRVMVTEIFKEGGSGDA